MIFRKIILKLSVIIFFTLSCNSFKGNNDKINNKIAQGKDAMKSSLADSIIRFELIYNRVVKETYDSSKVAQINKFNFVVISVNKFIDSLITELDKFDNLDPNNVRIMNDIFVHKGIGDTLYYKLARFYEIAINIDSSKDNNIELYKSRNKILLDQNVDAFRSEYFGTNSPLGVIMTLYYFKSEIINYSKKSLL